MRFQFGAACLLLATCPILAQESNDVTIDEIIVAGHSITSDTLEIAVNQELLVDAAMSLKNLPGANVNQNGLVTGIAQYRGMYGDRVAITIDEHAVVGGGPNAMDAPLSYVSPMITDSIVIERGIASVSSSPESIGGYLKARLDRGRFGNEDFALSGFAGTRHSNNGSLSTTAGRLTASNQSHRLSLLAELDRGDDISTRSGVIRPSAVNRDRYDISYAFTDGESHVVLFAGKLRTHDSGTAALPMDIRYIDTDMAGAHFVYALSSRLSIDGRVAANDVEHEMDNFALRGTPPDAMQRMNHATGKGLSFSTAAKIDFDDSSLSFGLDGIDADHDSTITNPTNTMFRIANFADVKRDLFSVFVEWNRDFEASDLEFGLSAKRVNTEAGVVAFSGIMSPAAGVLRDEFNAAERDLGFDDIDAVVKFRISQNERLEWRLEAASKSRAPSYQELYLWLPMQATGGLADGRTYIGDLGLQSETSNELNLGAFVAFDRFSISPQVFYKQVDGYIQGLVSTNAAANMMSMMMTGKPALQFSNTDAEIYGIDVAWDYRLSERLMLDGIANYARGRRTDVSDDLYRLAPPNVSVGVTYESESWSLGTRLTAYAKQDKVAVFNDELETSAYEILSMKFLWNPTESLRFEAQVDNVLNTSYEDHLSGINRAAGSDIAVGSRLPGAERTLSAGLIFSF